MLRDRYTLRAAEVLRALAQASDPGASRDRHQRADRDQYADRNQRVERDDGAQDSGVGTPPARRRRWLLVVGLLIVVAAVAVTLVVTQTGTRLPGQTETGSVSLSGAAQLRRTLAQAEALESSGDSAQALRLYAQVLGQDPTQPEALAESGWLEFEAGVKSRDADGAGPGPGSGAGGRTRQPRRLRAAPVSGVDASRRGRRHRRRRRSTASSSPTDPRRRRCRSAQPFITQAFRQAGQPVPAMPATTQTTTQATTPSTTARPAG